MATAKDVRTLLIAESFDLTWFLLSTQHAAQRPATALSAAMPAGLYSTQHFAIVDRHFPAENSHNHRNRQGG